MAERPEELDDIDLEQRVDALEQYMSVVQGKILSLEMALRKEKGEEK